MANIFKDKKKDIPIISPNSGNFSKKLLVKNVKPIILAEGSRNFAFGSFSNFDNVQDLNEVRELGKTLQVVDNYQ